MYTRRLPPVFIHLPKTAGTFIRSVLHGKYQNVQAAYPTPPFKRLGDMNAADKERLLRADVVIGHESVHSFRTELHPDLQFCTILRNPVDRLISYYNHLMTHSALYKVAKVTPLRFIESRADYELDNLQLRYLSGRPVTESVDEEDLDRAIRMVADGRIVPGIQELMEATVARLPLFDGVRLADYPRQNESVFGFTRASLTELEIDAFRQRSSLDMRLYSYCLDHFRGRKST